MVISRTCRQTPRRLVNDIVDRGGATASGRSVVLIYASSLASSAIEVISGSRAGFNLTGQIDVIDDQGGLRLGRSLDPPPNTNCQTPIMARPATRRPMACLSDNPPSTRRAIPLALSGIVTAAGSAVTVSAQPAPRAAGAIRAARSNLFEPVRVGESGRHRGHDGLLLLGKQVRQPARDIRLIRVSGCDLMSSSVTSGDTRSMNGR